jgi:hypothetical protein
MPAALLIGPERDVLPPETIIRAIAASNESRRCPTRAQLTTMGEMARQSPHPYCRRPKAMETLCRLGWVQEKWYPVYPQSGWILTELGWSLAPNAFPDEKLKREDPAQP